MAATSKSTSQTVAVTQLILIIGFILLGGGLLAVFVSELQAYRTNTMEVFAEASRYTAIFYDYLVIPGALLVGTTGFFLVRELRLGFFTEP